MTRPDRSVLIFGCYTLVMGVVLLLIPASVLPVFGLSVTGQPWISLMGFVLLCSSYYYIRSALTGNRQFAIYTIHTRLAAPLVIGFMMLTEVADWRFLAFGIIDGLGGIWTLYELKKAKT